MVKFCEKKYRYKIFVWSLDLCTISTSSRVLLTSWWIQCEQASVHQLPGFCGNNTAVGHQINPLHLTSLTEHRTPYTPTLCHMCLASEIQIISKSRISIRRSHDILPISQYLGTPTTLSQITSILDQYQKQSTNKCFLNIFYVFTTTKHFLIRYYATLIFANLFLYVLL